MELRHQIGVLRSWFWILVASVLLAGGAAYLVSTSLPKVYEGEVTLIVGGSLNSTNPNINDLIASQRLSQTYADLATTTPILEQVIARNGVTATPDDFRKRIVAEAPRDSTLVDLTVQGGDPAQAAQLANSLAAEMIAASPAVAGRNTQVQQFIDTDLAATQSQIKDTQVEIQRLANLPSRSSSEEQQLQALQGRIVTLRQTYATMLGFSSSSGANLLTVVDPASPPEQPASPRVLLNTILAALVGLLLAIGFAFLLEYLDDTVKSTDDVEAVAVLPTLGTITKMKGDKDRSEIYRLAAILYPRAPVAEAYRTLRTNIEFAAVDAPLSRSRGGSRSAWARTARRISSADSAWRRASSALRILASRRLRPRALARTDRQAGSLRGGFAPAEEDCLHLISHGDPGVVPPPAPHQVLVVACPSVADVRADREVDRLGEEGLRVGAAPDPAAVLLTRMLRDGEIGALRAVWVTVPDRAGEGTDEFRVQQLPPLRGADPSRFALLGVGQAVPLSTPKGLLLNQRALALVALARHAPANHHRGQLRVRCRTASQRRVTGGQIDKMPEIGAVHAPRHPPIVQVNEIPREQLVPALAAGALAPSDREHDDPRRLALLPRRLPRQHGPRQRHRRPAGAAEGGVARAISPARAI